MKDNIILSLVAAAMLAFVILCYILSINWLDNRIRKIQAEQMTIEQIDLMIEHAVDSTVDARLKELKK